jgi:hypothetical protein
MESACSQAAEKETRDRNSLFATVLIATARIVPCQFVSPTCSVGGNDIIRFGLPALSTRHIAEIPLVAHHLLALVGRLIDAGIQYRQHL